MGLQVSRCDRDCRTMNAEAAKAAETMTARVTLHRVDGAPRSGAQTAGAVTYANRHPNTRDSRT